MSIARSVADVLRDHVVLEYEAIDRMYLNVYVPHLQTVGAMVGCRDALPIDFAAKGKVIRGT